MRTTLTIDDDLMQAIRDAAHRTGRPLKLVVNEALRAGLAQRRERPTSTPYETPTFSMGHPPRVHLDKALALASSLEDEEVARKLTMRK